MFERKKEKIFCIGLNKTGTTSLEQVLTDFGYSLGDQAKGELLAKDWFQRDFKSIIKYCNSADAFQDIPFSLPFTYVHLDQHFPNAKFILTERDDVDQWYQSLTMFHSRLWADGNQIPNIGHLKQAKYRYKGFAYDINRMMFATPEDDPYKKEVLTKYYEQHNYSVQEYFRSKPEKLLVINIANDEDYVRLCEFLGKKPIHNGFPHLNKTKI